MLASGACLLLTTLSWWIFVGTTRGQYVDDAARIGSASARDELSGLSTWVLNAVSVPLLLVVLVAAILVSLLQRRWSIAIGAIMVLAGANFTTQILKDLLQRPEADVARLTLNSFPSGHVTVAASIAATALLVVSVRWRPIVAFGGAVFVATMGIATMVGTAAGAWHRASDVIASMFITATWYFAVEAVLTGMAGSDGEPGTTRGRPAGLMRVVLRTLAIIGGLSAGLAGGVLLASLVRAPIETSVGYRLAFAGAVVGVVAVSCFINALMLRLRPHHPPPTSTIDPQPYAG